jgi:Putative restriction endonuclease
MDLPTLPEAELIDPDEAEILASFRALPTEDDLPCDDGEPMETPRHREQMHLLIDSLKVHWADRTGYYVGGNMFVHYDPENKRPSRGPDFFLVLNVVDRERKSWVVWQEGMRFPDVIIELLSDTTRAIDKGEKKSFMRAFFVRLSTTSMTRGVRNSLAITCTACTITRSSWVPSRKSIRWRRVCIWASERDGSAGSLSREPRCQHRWSLPSKQNTGLSRRSSRPGKKSSEPSKRSNSWPCIDAASVSWKEEENKSRSALRGCSLVLAVCLHKV